ncbi:MAG: DUF488 family protein [Candidatus Helarchaeota archaeon]
MIIYTFGLKVTHRGEDRLEALRQFIEQHSITVVLDVRSSVGNHFPRWKCNGQHIAEMVQRRFNGKCRYVHVPALGIPYEIRQKYKGRPKDAEHWYLNYLWERKDLTFTAYQEETLVLLCVENIRDPMTPYCHRIWLRNWLVDEYNAGLGEVVE